MRCYCFFVHHPPTTKIYTLSLHDALPICVRAGRCPLQRDRGTRAPRVPERMLWSDRGIRSGTLRSEEHTSELQSHVKLVCRLLLEKKKIQKTTAHQNNSHKPAKEMIRAAE